MKIKTNILARNKSLFFGAGFTLFTGLVLLINWLFNFPIRSNRLSKWLSRKKR